MDTTTITCPKCQNVFPLTSAIEQPILDRLRAQFEAESARNQAELSKREQQLALKAEQIQKAQETLQQQLKEKLAEERKRIAGEQEQKAKEAVAIELRDLQQQVTEKTRKLNEAQQFQLELIKQRRDLEEQKAAFELEKTKQIEAERARIREEAKKAAMETASAELRDLQEQINLKDKKLAEAQEAELKLRKEKTEFEEQKRAFDLELARRADEIKEAVKKQKDEEFRLKEAESNKKLDEMKQQIDELKRKAEQGSQQTQGEVLELDLEASIRRCFSDDEIVPVPKGAHGGDLLQHVRDERAHPCGTIIWESKRTKAWSDGWIEKLKDDRLAAKAQLAIIVTTAMPKSAASFECREGIWIAPPQLAVPVAAALRLSLIGAAAAKRAVDGRQDKMSMVYDYLTGPEFKNRVMAVVDAFTAMRADLDDEKRAIQRVWAKREKQIDRVLVNTAGLHGDLAGIIGRSLPAIEMLELAALPGEPAVNEK